MSYRLEIGLALLLASAVGVAVFAAHRTPKPQERDFRASTFLSGPDGSQALYRVMVRLGRPVERRRTALFALVDDTSQRRASPPALVVVLDPPMGLESAELDQVVRFVQHGGAVLAAGYGGGITRCAGWRLHPEGALDDGAAASCGTNTIKDSGGSRSRWRPSPGTGWSTRPPAGRSSSSWRWGWCGW